MDSDSRARFDGMLNAQLRSSWGHTAELTGVREGFVIKFSILLSLGYERANPASQSTSYFQLRTKEVWMCHWVYVFLIQDVEKGGIPCQSVLDLRG